MVDAKVLNQYINYHCTQEKLDKQYKCNEIHQRLVENITSAELDFQYPTHYAGDFIDDKDNLIICITEKEETVKEFYENICGLSNLKFKEVEFSLNELETIKNYIGLFKDKNVNSKLISNISLVAKDIRANKVMVGLKENTQEKIEDFRKQVLDSACLEFINFDADFKLTQQVNAGHPLSGSTLGYRARRGGVDGFIVSGHVYSPGQSIIDVVGNRLGSVQSIAHRVGPQVDAGWSPGADLDLTNTIHQLGGSLSPRIGVPTIGSSTVLSRGKESGLRGGTVLHTNADILVGNVEMKNVMLVDWLVQAGDSGGPVFWNTTGTTYLTVGNIIGVHRNLNVSVVGRAGYIRSQLQVERY